MKLGRVPAMRSIMSPPLTWALMDLGCARFRAPRGRAQQVTPQMPGTSATHIESHMNPQQKESAAHTLAAQGEQSLVSGTPGLHSGCAQPHAVPQYMPTSTTHTRSHDV